MSKKRTVVGRFVHNKWIAINIRAKNGKYAHLRNEKSACYEDVEILMTQPEFRTWCWSQKTTIEALVRPSIDRIDKTKHYSLDNLQVIELEVNIRKDKTIFKDGFCVCYRCRNRLPEEEFAKDNRRANGRSTCCKRCDSKRKRLNQYVEAERQALRDLRTADED